MSTHSSIAKINADGSVSAITCHWNGYLHGNGVILDKYYQDEEKIDYLLNLGYISKLGASPLVAPILSVYGNKALEARDNFSESKYFDIIDPYTLAYNRDNGDDLVIDHYKDFASFLFGKPDNNTHEYDYLDPVYGKFKGMQAYTYIYNNGTWYLVEMPEQSTDDNQSSNALKFELTPLSDAIAQNAKD